MKTDITEAHSYMANMLKKRLPLSPFSVICFEYKKSFRLFFVLSSELLIISHFPKIDARAGKSNKYF